MTVSQIEVETRIPGGFLGAPERLVLEIPLLERLTIAGLIRLKVEEESRRLAAMQVLDQHSAKARLGREYQDLGASGMLARASLPVNLEVEVAKAQRAFSTGRFLILVDGKRYTQLDEQVTLMPQSAVKFIRLMPLTGG
jgi:hypothetical protein